MRRELSVFLDGSRVAAAVLVFVNHCLGLIETSGRPTPLMAVLGAVGQHGRGAVAIFFVLSGFVIKYISDRRENTLRRYLTARATRIYSVVIPVLIVVVACDGIGMLLKPDLYVLKDFVSTVPLGVSIPVSMAFLGELWSSHVFVGSDEPFWSLSFEVWYYAIFAAYLFCRGRLPWPLVIAILLVAGPKIVAFLPLWVLGAVCFHVVDSRSTDRASTSIALLQAICCLLVAPCIYMLTKHYIPDSGNMYDPFNLDRASLENVVYYSSFGVGFAALVFAVSLMGSRITWLLSIVERPVRWLAGGTFTLYLLHQPLLLFFGAVFAPLGDGARPTLVVVASFACCLLVAEIGERRKHLWANMGRSLFRSVYAQS